jgi:hypothetical protein
MLLEGIDWRSPQRMQGTGARWVRAVQASAAAGSTPT